MGQKEKSGIAASPPAIRPLPSHKSQLLHRIGGSVAPLSTASLASAPSENTFVVRSRTVFFNVDDVNNNGDEANEKADPVEVKKLKTRCKDNEKALNCIMAIVWVKKALNNCARGRVEPLPESRWENN